MSSSFTGSFDQLDGDSLADSTQPFDNGTYAGAYSSSSSNFPDTETVAVESPIYGGFSSDQAEVTSFSNDAGYIREWRRHNAVRLEEKEKREKEIVSQLLNEAEEFKINFLNKRKVTCETTKSTNREREKVFVAGQEKFHAEADKGYWKAIAELIPNEVPAIEKKRGKKDQDKKPSIVVIQGPKPGKPTDLSRMRQILVKLKHNTPPHLQATPSPAAAGPSKDAKATPTEPAAVSVAASSEPLAVA